MTFQGAADPANWMATLPDDRLISDLSIPGTHDTCARFGGPAATCQSMILAEQLQAGIRFIDIRCRHINNTFAIHHESVYQNLEFGGGVRDVCLSFLQSHPGETIILSVKTEYNEQDCTRTFEETFDWYLVGNRSNWYLNNVVPKMSDVRGRIVLFRRFGSIESPLGIDASNWPDNSMFLIDNSAHIKVQDHYDVGSLFNIKEKWEQWIAPLLWETETEKNHRWYINFMSGASGGAYPNAVAKGAPSFTGINSYLHDRLTNTSNGLIVGTLLMDFPEYPDNALIKQIIGRNA